MFSSSKDIHIKDQVAMSWDEYMDLLYIPYAEIESATNNFADENLLTQGTYCKVYKGQLLQQGELINIVVRKSRNQFLTFNELMFYKGLKHKNINSVLKICSTENETLIIHTYEANESLDKHLSGLTLTWMRRLHICVKVAHALKSLHHDYNMIHGNIKSSKILLDHNWEPKLHGFAFAVVDKHDGPQSTSKYFRSLQYLDPAHENTHNYLTNKSDIFSFGVLLFEVLFGREASIQNNDNWYFARLARSHYEEGKLDDLIYPDLRRQMNLQSLNIFAEIAYYCLKVRPSERPDTNQVLTKLEKALELQLTHEQSIVAAVGEGTSSSIHLMAYQLQEISLATNNFSEENLIGGLGNVYKGRLMLYGNSKPVDIVVRRFDCKYGQGDAFKTEISMLSSFEHKNIISFVGFCDENEEKIIIYEHALHGSLDQHLSDPNLTWHRRLKICLGVARALNYIHYDVIHCDINSSKIFLDKDWEPKIFGFELSTKYPRSLRHRLLFSRYFNNTNMTPKYDVYSFGVLLFEVACGRKPTIGDHGIKKELDDIIDPNLRKQMDTQLWSVFIKVTYSCLNEQLVKRPTMDQIVKELEDMLELQWSYEYLEQSRFADQDTSSNLLKMEWLKIPLSEIKSATSGFDEAYYLGAGGYGRVYKADLDVLDIESVSSMERKPKDKLPKRRTTVAIKCIIDREDENSKQGFLTEIELLSSCKHPNIVSLLGFCVEARDMILVYEYAVKGSLSDYLGSTHKNIYLPWERRLRICLDIAHGINYLHTHMEGKPRIIHRDIKSENILLDANLNAKVADFGLSKFHPTNQQASTIYTKHIAGTEFYLDPEYLTTGKYKKESDIYSFGVVLFEILSGRLAYDSTYVVENEKGLAPIARRRFNEGTLKELIDPKMIEEDDEQLITVNRGPNQDSFETFSSIAYRCLAETQAKRPTMEVVIKELHSALNLQGEFMILTRFQLSDIELATEKFSEIYCIESLPYGKVYKAELNAFDNKTPCVFEENSDCTLPKTRITVAIKRIASKISGQEKDEFLSEIEMRTSYMHPNIVPLLGFCDEGDEMILVYELSSNKSLEDYLINVDNMNNLTWTQRLHMCLAVARGLDHLHTKIHNQQRVKLNDIRSANILIGRNWEPKIAYYGIPAYYLKNQDRSIPISKRVYSDPELNNLRAIKKQPCVFSFGVILFEIFCWKVAYDPIYITENDQGLAAIACHHIYEGTIKSLIDPKLNEVSNEDILTSNKGPNQDSLDTFLKIAYHCLVEPEVTMKVVIKELEIALNFQENLMKSLQISLKDIEVATTKFSQKNWFGNGRCWEAYTGELPCADTNSMMIAKRWNSKFDGQFQTELDILLKRKHANIIGIVGYCNEMNEKIIIYEHMSKGNLDRHLKDFNLKWMKRLQICIDVASALEFLHGGDVTLKKVVHRNIKSQCILLNDDWDAKISNFELSSLFLLNQDMEHISHDAYLDPQYNRGFLTEKSDIYSFGVVLLEILCGRLAVVEGSKDNSQSLGPLAKHCYTQGKLDEIIFEDIKEQIVPKSLTTFVDVAFQCLHEDDFERPHANKVAIQLKKALEFQEELEIWEAKLPRDYKEILELSETPEIYQTEKKRDLYKKFSSGILLTKEKVLFKLSDSGEANKMISATTFSYENHKSHKWRSIHKSRFRTVAKILDISNLMIKITLDTRFLSPNVVYGVYLAFKFCNPRIVSCTSMYVNLKYRNETKAWHSYFATRRDDEWMMIELYRFVNHKKDVIFKFLLESFSRYYCRSDAIYIEGIEFRAIKKVADEDIKNLKEVQKSYTDLEDDDVGEKRFSLSELNGKKHLMLSATEVLYNSPKLKSFRFKPSAESRFQDVVELLPKQVFRMKYEIEIQRLSPSTEYACYLVFKVSERSLGLHCPVKVQDLLVRKNKENKIIYFRCPASLNQHDSFWVPLQRKDGWMEVIVWKFNSKYNKFWKNFIPMNLKLITYEGTMSGLIICGLEFRPL